MDDLIQDFASSLTALGSAHNDLSLFDFTSPSPLLPRHSSTLPLDTPLQNPPLVDITSSRYSVGASRRTSRYYSAYDFTGNTDDFLDSSGRGSSLDEIPENSTTSSDALGKRCQPLDNIPRKGPLLELTLAGDVLRFVELSFKLLTSSGELYRKAELEAPEVIAASVKQVRKTAHTAIQKCRMYEAKLERGLSIVWVFEDPEVDAGLQKLCDESRMISECLRENLNKLLDYANVPSRGWTGMQAALTGVWSKDGMSQLVQRLKTIRSSLESTVLPGLCVRATFGSVSQSSGFGSLHEENQELVCALLNVEGSTKQDLNVRVLALSLMLSRVEFITSGESASSAQAVLSDIYQQPSQRYSNLFSAREQEMSYRDVVSNGILGILTVDSSKPWKGEVPDAHKKTFDPIFRHPDMAPHAPEGKHWSDFRSWLEKKGGVYWINGTEASGKSALMRSIVSHPTTGLLLRSWASRHEQKARLLTAQFSFPASGTDDQRSHSGLYRSLLHALLKKEHRLVPIIFAAEWSRRYLKLLGYAPLFSLGDTLESHIISGAAPALLLACKRLFRQAIVPIRACIFIDGLDQYEDKTTDLADFLSNLPAESNVKCCVSSWRSPNLNAAFAQHPSLRIEDLTFPSMQRLVDNHLRSDSRVSKIAEAYPEAFRLFVNQVVEAAQGGFLWMRLAVSSLIRSHSDHEGIMELHGRLREIPSQLEDLYDHIVTSADDADRGEVCRMLQLQHASSIKKNDDWRLVTPITLLGMSFAAEDHPSMVLAARPQFLSQSETRQRCEDVASRIRTRCLGLLEVRTWNLDDATEAEPTAEVVCAHRTIETYLKKWETQKLLRQQSGTSLFNPNFAILKATVLLLKSQKQASSAHQRSYRHIDDGMVYARRAEEELEGSVVLGQVIDELITTCEPWFRLNTLSQPVFHPNCTKYSIAAQCGLPHYLRYLLGQENVIAKKKSRLRRGKRTLLSLTLLPPAGFERFVSADVVETLLEFGGNTTEACQLVVAFLYRWDAAQREPALDEWKGLLKTLLQLQKRISEDDVRALETVFAKRPADWADVKWAIEAGGARVTRGNEGRSQRVLQRALRKLICCV